MAPAQPARTRSEPAQGNPGRVTQPTTACPLHFTGETREAGRKADSTSPSGSRQRSRYSRVKPSHPARTAARTRAPTEGLCARAMAVRDPARHRLGAGERCERVGMGGLGAVFEACGSCAPSRVAEEVVDRGRPAGESNPAASGRPEAGYRSRPHPDEATRWQLQQPTCRSAQRDCQSAGQGLESGGK